MSNMIPFQQAQVPSFLQNGPTADQVRQLAAAAAAGTGGVGLNKISFKQSRFRMIVGGQESIIPSLELDLVIVRVNDGISKTWYEKEWNPNDEAGAPECSSDDGVRPRADAPKPQCGPDGLCANCPQNQWGSKINKVTQEKIKACTDTKRMAIMPPGQDGRYTNHDQDLFQVSVPPASLKDFGGFVRGLAAMPTPAAYNMVVATLSFDPNVSYPKVLFKPKRWLDSDEWAVISRRYADDETMRIAGIAAAQTMRPTQLAGPAQQQPVQQQPVQQQPVQQQPVQQAAYQNAPQQVQQQAPAQQAAGGWGDVQQQPVQQPQQQAPVQQAANGWGDAPVQQVAQQPAQQQAAGGWGDTQAQPVTQQPTQQQPAQQSAPVQRERGKPAPGKARRTKAEIEEDNLADQRDAQAAGGQVQQPQQAPAQQPAAGGWGDAPVQQVAQQPVQQTPQGNAWDTHGQQPQQVAQQPVQQQPVQQQAGTGWGDTPAQQAPQQTGAPSQPNVIQGDVSSAFAGWDD